MGIFTEWKNIFNKKVNNEKNDNVVEVNETTNEKKGEENESTINETKQETKTTEENKLPFVSIIMDKKNESETNTDNNSVNVHEVIQKIECEEYEDEKIINEDMNTSVDIVDEVETPFIPFDFENGKYDMPQFKEEF